jgi:hypothetical protein
MVDDYAYARLDFRGDPDLVLPEGAQWGKLGKKCWTTERGGESVVTVLKQLWFF